MARRLPLVAALAGLAVIAVALVVVLAQERVPVVGGNNEFIGAPHFAVAPGQEACQPDEVLPRGAGIVRLHAQATGGAGALRVELRSSGRAAAAGERRWDGAERDVDIPLDAVVRREARGDLCVRNLGTVETAVWSFGRPDSSAYTDAGPVGFRIRTRYLGPGPESRLAAADGTVRRMATARGSVLDGWAPWGALAAALGLVAVVLVATRREPAA